MMRTRPKACGFRKLHTRNHVRLVLSAACMQTDAALIRASPVRLLAKPLLLFMLMCGLGVYGVIAAAKHRVDEVKAISHEGVATEIAAGLSSQLEVTQASSAALASYVRQEPRCTIIEDRFATLASDAWGWVNKGSLLVLELAPAAVLTMFYPPSPGNPYGLDLLKRDDRRADTLLAIAAGNMTIQVGLARRLHLLALDTHPE